MNDLREDINDLIKKIPVLILQFGSDTCGPCHAIHAIRYKLEQWMSEHKEVEAQYVDIEKNMEISSQMGIFSAPTVLVYMDGQLVARESGYFSLDALLGDIERYLELRK